MKFHITFYVLTVLVATSLATVPANIEDDIQNISAQAGKLDTDITRFPNTGGSMASALTIHNDAVGLGKAIDKGTSDIEAVTEPMSESDGQNISTGVEDIKPTILDALTQIVTKKPAFDGLPTSDDIPAVVLQDLENLNSSTSGFEAAFISAVPADLKDQAISSKSAVDAAFATAIAAYSS